MPAGPHRGLPARAGAFQACAAASASASRSSGAPAAEVELELPARQVPAPAQQIVAQRTVAQRMARHQVRRRSRHAHAGDGRQARVRRAALFATPQLVRARGPAAAARPRASAAFLTLGQRTVGIGGLGRLRLQELEQLAFGKNFGRRLRIVGGHGVIEQPPRGVRRHGVLFHGEQHAVVGFARGRAAR